MMFVSFLKKGVSANVSGTSQMQLQRLRRNPIEDGAISGFSGQKSVPE